MVRKVKSVEEFFTNNETEFGILTETWTNEKNEIKILDELKYDKGLSILMKSRNGRRGGGTAIVYRDKSISLKRHDFFTGTYEILAAKGTIASARKDIYIFAVYYPPSMTGEEVQRMNQLISDEVLKLKMNKDDPLVIIAGDMNLKDCTVFTEEYDDIKLILTPPTRGMNVLDCCYTNCKIENVRIGIPLWSDNDVDSDHKTVVYDAVFVGDKYEYVNVLRRRITKKGEEEFVKSIKEVDWTDVMVGITIDEKTDRFHEIVEGIKDRVMPWKNSRIRTDEDPWITEHVRFVAKKRNKAFRDLGRGEEWKKLRDEVRMKIANARRAYYDREVDKICNATDKRSLAFTALKNLKSSERPKQWTICDLDRDKKQEELVEDLADYFSRITADYDCVSKDDLPTTFDRPIYELTPGMVAARIRESKKPNSTVPGDIPPKLLNDVADWIAEPLCSIFNCLPRQGRWPEAWKLEYQTIIPKTKNPENFDQLRNLSCTNFMSKILETFVLDSLKSEVALSELQYGGTKGSGTDNFLIELWNNVLETLDNGNAVAVMSVDFSKAFNRLSHGGCLEKLATKNASNQTLSMVLAFLEGRQMCVRSGNVISSKRDVRGGSPQGTKLGNLLFCLSIDDIADGTMTEESRENDGNISERSSPERAIPDEYLPNASSTPHQNNNASDESINPNPFGFRRKKNVMNDTAPFDLLPRDEYQNTTTWEIGYVDDLNICETLSVQEGEKSLSTRKEEINIRAKGCEEKYVVIKENGEKIGLAINAKKTQLLCLSGNNTSNVSCYASIEGTRIQAAKTMKIVGYHFSNKPTVKEHVTQTLKKFARLIWVIVNLKKARLEKLTIVRAYTSMIRPVVEYASNVYHTMLTVGLSEKIERCQKRIMKMIFGFEIPYENALEMAGIERLSARREGLFRRFCHKMSKSERFCRKWLPLKSGEEDGRTLRKEKKYIEFNAKTKRLYDSPLFAMRRLLNEEA